MCINIKPGITTTDTSSQVNKPIEQKDNSVIRAIKLFYVDKAKSSAASPSHISFFDNLKHSVLEVAGDIAVTLGKVPIIDKVGDLIYGEFTESHDKPNQKYKDKQMGNTGSLIPNLLRGSQPRKIKEIIWFKKNV